jgi:hypothetical protein
MHTYIRTHTQDDCFNENSMLQMSITPCVRGLVPFWLNLYAQCALQAVNSMAFSIEKRVILVERYLKTGSFKTTQSDYSHRFECPGPETNL